MDGVDSHGVTDDGGIAMTTHERQRRRRIGTRPDPGLHRARLLHKLNGLDYRVALITAPAGFGKSTLLTQYAASCATTVVDYVVDSTDVAPGALLQGILTALNHDTTPPAQVVSPVSAKDSEFAWTLMASVLYRLGDLGNSCAGGLTCILDDLQFIEGSAAVDELSALITQLPDGVRMVLSARRMPTLDLAAHRVAGAVMELDADDFRFRSWEIEELFTQDYGMPLPPAEMARLARATNGWAAGLQLFHLATYHLTDVERRGELEHLSRSRASFVRDYLTRNVLQEMDSELRSFLLRSSVLGHLSTELCSALLGDVGSAEHLEHLVRNQLFITTVGPGEYRLHEVLRSYLEALLAEEMSAVDLRALYHRAARLLEGHGLMGEAVRAHLCAEDVGAALSVLGGNAIGSTQRDDHVLYEFGDEWLERVPIGLLAHDERLHLLTAQRLVRIGRLQDAVVAYRSVAGGDGEAASRAQNELMRLTTWLTPESRPPDPTCWTTLVRAALTAPGATRAGCLLLGPSGQVGAALLLMLEGDLREAVNELDVCLRELGPGFLSDIASVARSLALWLADGVDPSHVVARVRDRADRDGQHWLARCLRAVLLAFPLPEDPPFQVLMATIYKDATAGSDPWTKALCHLFAGLGAAFRPAHPLHGAGATLELDLAQAHFNALGAAAVAAWPKAALDVLAGNPPVSLSALDVLMGCHLGASHQTPRMGPGRSMDNYSLHEANHCPSVVIRCLGTFEISFDGVPVNLWTVKPRARSVLRMLAWKSDVGVQREVLLDALWPGSDPFISSKSLHVALSQIRAALGEHSGHLRRLGDMYALHVDAVHDVRALTANMAAVDHLDRVSSGVGIRAHLEAVVASMGGEFLVDETPLDWVVDERARITALQTRACCRLGQLRLESGDPGGAAVVSELGLIRDRFSDTLWSTLMVALDAQGCTAELCRARLRYHGVLDELGVTR